MNFERELHLRLNDENRPFPKRLRLAQNAYYATGGYSESLTLWIGTNLKVLSETDFNQFLTEWDKLLKYVDTQRVPIFVKLMMEVVTKRLKDYDLCVEENTFHYVVDILENVRVQSYFFTDPESYKSLVEALLSALTAGPTTDNYVCERLFQSMESFSRTMSVREYPALFIDSLLIPSVHLANAVGPCSSLEQHLVSCVEKAIFYKNSLAMMLFLESLFKTKKTKAEQGKEVPKEMQTSSFYCKPGCKLLEKLGYVLTNDNPKDAVLTYTTIFKCLLKSNNADVMCLKLLVTVCPILGIHVNNAKLKVELPEDLLNSKTTPTELSFLVFDSILSIIYKEGITLPDSDELHFVNWVECLWRTLLSLPLKIRQSSPYLRSLSTLLQLHPRVVLNRKLSILTDTLVALSPDKEIPEFVAFLRVLLSIHQKRFTVHELLGNLFTNSKQLLNTRKRLNTGSLGVHCVVPQSVYADIQKYAADWPSTPVLDFIDFMLTQLQTLAFTSDNLRSVYSESATAIGVRLLCGVLTGARVVDHCGNEKIRLSYVTRFKSLSQLQKQMAAVAEASEGDVCIQAFLELEYTWAAVITMLQHYCPEAVESIHGTIQVKRQDEPLTSAFAVTSLHRHITEDVWESIKTKVISSEDVVIQRLCVRLEVQSLRYFVITNRGSRPQASLIAESISPLLVSCLDVEGMPQDICFAGNLLGKQALKLLTDKVVDTFLSGEGLGGTELSKRHFQPLEESKSVTCGMIYCMLERLANVCSSEGHWPTTEKIIRKLTNNGFENMSDYASDVWEDVLSSVGKSLNKALKKTQGPPAYNAAELSQVKEILRVFVLHPLAFLPENLQTAVIFGAMGLSVDLLSVEESTEKSSVYDLIYHQLIFGILERWPITREAPSLQNYLDMAVVLSHVQVVRSLKNPVDVKLVHILLGLSTRSAKSVTRVLDLFFSGGPSSADNFVIQQEMLNVVCKDSLTAECREVVKVTDCVSRVVSVLSSYIQSERPKKHLIPVYTLLLCHALKRKEKLEDLVPHLEEYCKLAVKGLRKDGGSRLRAEYFVREILKYHEVQKYLPENFIVDVWTALRESDEPNGEIASSLFSWAKKDVFEAMIQGILKELKSTPGNFTLSKNGLLLLESLLKSPLISEYSLDGRQFAVTRFVSQPHVFLLYPPRDLLKVVLSIVESSKVVVQVITADAIFQAISTVTSRGNKTSNMEFALDWFRILHGMLFHRSSQTMDCLPTFTGQLRLLMQTIVHCSRNIQQLDECIYVAQGIEKMFQTIVKAKMTRNFSRIGAYLLADFLKHFEGRLPQAMKVILENIACEILGFLDTYAQRFLAKAVSAESSEILREITRIHASRRSKIV